MSFRDTTSARGSQDGSGGSMNASGNVSGTGSGSGAGARGPGGGLRGGGGAYRTAQTGRAGRVGVAGIGARRQAIPIPPVRRVVPIAPVPPPVFVNPPRVFPSIPAPTPPPVQRPFSSYIRSPYVNDAVFTPKAINPSGVNGSTHYKTSGPESGSFRGGGSARFRKGGNVDKPSVLKRIMARNKEKKSSAVEVTQRVTKTPWKKAAKIPAFAKGGAVEKFMTRYPNFKLA